MLCYVVNSSVRALILIYVYRKKQTGLKSFRGNELILVEDITSEDFKMMIRNFNFNHIIPD